MLSSDVFENWFTWSSSHMNNKTVLHQYHLYSASNQMACFCVKEDSTAANIVAKTTSTLK